MEYRRLGKSGVKVSQLSLGSWVTFGKQVDIKAAMEIMSTAKELGINFFDNAEVYASGRAEEIMGEVLKKLNWSRLSYLVSSKFFWGIEEGPNSKNTLNRKYLLHVVPQSLKRLGLDYIDLIYCHRSDPSTPMEEVVWAMHNIIERGYALYWGTSEWSASEIQSAFEVAERYSLHKPIVEQPQYSLMWRHRVEIEYEKLYKNFGLGLTTWSPLASGVLTGKYLKGVPENSRLSMANMAWLKENLINTQTESKVKEFVKIAESLSVSPAALAIAWCSANPNVSSVILGASKMGQLKENLQALLVLPKLTASVKSDIEKIFPATHPGA